MRASLRAVGIVCLLASTACGVETIVHDLQEREANQIIELLSDNDIGTTKGTLDNGRTVSYTISVPQNRRVDAIKLLNRYEMPRRRDSGYMEVFKDAGLIPTSTEEKAKQLSALEGEIEKQLRVVDGLLDVQVQLVIPEETALRTAQDVRTPTTASVTVKYLPGQGGAKPLSESQIQAVVAGGVERLTPDNVVVVMTPVTGGPRADKNEEVTEPHAMSSKAMKNGLVVAICVIFVLCIFLFIVFIQGRLVRTKLERLQRDIEKARRKSELPQQPS